MGTGEYWAGRGAEHRQHAQQMSAEATITDDPDDRRGLELSAIDAGILAEACVRNAEIYEQT